MTAITDYEVEAFDEGERYRTELRRYPNSLVMVYLRPAVGGGWYVRDSITLRLQNGSEAVEA